MTLFRACKKVTDCAGFFSYLLFHSAFCMCAFCARVDAYKVALNEAISSVGDATWRMKLWQAAWIWMISVSLQATRDNCQHKKHRLNRQNKQKKQQSKPTNQPQQQNSIASKRPGYQCYNYFNDVWATGRLFSLTATYLGDTKWHGAAWTLLTSCKALL